MSMINILKFTMVEEFSYDRDKVYEAACWLGEAGLITLYSMDLTDDIVREVFEMTYNSQLGNELFYGLNEDSGSELFTRSEDE